MLLLVGIALLLLGTISIVSQQLFDDNAGREQPIRLLPYVPLFSILGMSWVFAITFGGYIAWMACIAVVRFALADSEPDNAS